ncbi:glycosyltransferase [Falsochrobactrum sp. TDYN1]|uniref:Glycosyltransferase n=1 Tax=Falsochrobactrum tianjinense TaxID=2706015 RepID=A0A949PPK2_9HYPH|nr:glycosyltransferase [Falsochrobactrum sp. TDYN1]MBV2144304.1 glycosyltransferase [Falsochrobactrum sp. TDYN1]
MSELPSHIEVISKTPDLHYEDIEVVVSLPTFRRPEHLLRTLDTLNAQITGRRFAVVVIENEAEKREGAEVAAPLFEAGKYSGMLIVETKRGNCHAYNAGWLTAMTYFPNFKYVIVIDDDELADPVWIENMVSTAERYDVSLVGGPQCPIFEKPGAEKWANHPVFQPHYTRTGVVPIIYSSGNLLIARPVLEAIGFPFMELKFNFTGGGDTDFISRSKAKGFKIAWCAEGIVRETVPARRLERDWITARGLRNGMLSTLIEQRKRKDEPFGQIRVFLKSLALLACSPIKAVRKGFAAGSFPVGIYFIHIGLGRVMAHFGYLNEQYRNPDKN